MYVYICIYIYWFILELLPKLVKQRWRVLFVFKTTEELWNIILCVFILKKEFKMFYLTESKLFTFCIFYGYLELRSDVFWKKSSHS